MNVCVNIGNLYKLISYVRLTKKPSNYSTGCVCVHSLVQCAWAFVDFHIGDVTAVMDCFQG